MTLPGHDAVVDWALYVAGKRQPVPTYQEAVRRARRGDGFVWIGLHEPDEQELAGIAEDFDLHPLAVEDAIHAHQRPKLERYDDMHFTVFKTVRYVPHESVTEASQIVETGEVMVFLGAEFVVTVRHGEHGSLHAVRERLESQPALLALGPSSVLYAVADAVVDTYLDVAAQLEDDIDDIEERAFSRERDRDDIGRTYQVKRELLELRRSVTPLAAPLRHLAEQPVAEVDEEIREYFRDVEDHLTRAREMIASYDELLTSIIQASLAQLSMAENEDMRKITAWAAIIAVPTAIAGIYGMNFRHMPELDERWGYPAVLGVIAVICLV
ncbi:MAG TPA: magnesium/cobalt transporter CorA, partial [Jiangellales bacterium]|nr:magnesium/cobalt transporter CorA [Jiangellales bacterium]